MLHINKIFKLTLLILVLMITCVEAHASTFRVADYGAVPNDGLNDSPALQATCNAAANAGGGTILLPTGQTDILSPVSCGFLNKASVVILSGSGSRVRIAVGASAVGIRITNVERLTIENLVFHGTPTQNPYDAKFLDAAYALDIASCLRAVIRDCSFYGLASGAATGAVLHAERTDLTVEHTSFLGCVGSFYVPGNVGTVVRIDNWRGLTVRGAEFLDYGTLNGLYYSKTPAFGGSWIYTGAPLPLDAVGQRRIVIEDVSMDEGAAKGLFVANGAQFVSVKGLHSNVNNSSAGVGIWLHLVQHAKVEDSWFGYSRDDRPAIQISSSDTVELNGLKLTEAVSHIWIINQGATRKVILKYCQIPLNPSYPDGVRNQGGAAVEIID